jgi:hypothetical protein
MPGVVYRGLKEVLEDSKLFIPEALKWFSLRSGIIFIRMPEN